MRPWLLKVTPSLSKICIFASRGSTRDGLASADHNAHQSLGAQLTIRVASLAIGCPTAIGLGPAQWGCPPDISPARPIATLTHSLAPSIGTKLSSPMRHEHALIVRHEKDCWGCVHCCWRRRPRSHVNPGPRVQFEPCCHGCSTTTFSIPAWTEDHQILMPRYSSFNSPRTMSAGRALTTVSCLRCTPGRLKITGNANAAQHVHDAGRTQVSMKFQYAGLCSDAQVAWQSERHSRTLEPLIITHTTLLLLQDILETGWWHLLVTREGNRARKQTRKS